MDMGYDKGKPVFKKETRNKFFTDTVPKIDQINKENLTAINESLPNENNSKEKLAKLNNHFPQIRSTNPKKQNAPVQIMTNYMDYLKDKSTIPEYQTLHKQKKPPKQKPYDKPKNNLTEQSTTLPNTPNLQKLFKETEPNKSKWSNIGSNFINYLDN